MSDGPHHFRLPGEVAPLALQLAQGCRDPGRVAEGLAELMMNAIEHGILGLGFEHKQALIRAGRFDAELAERLARAPWTGLRASIRRDCLPDLVRFELADPGVGFDWRAWSGSGEARARAPNGRGIALARGLCFESLNYLGCGNRVEALALRGSV